MARYLWRQSPTARQRRPAALGLFLLAFTWCVLFFSLSGCKRPAYILPAFPFLALALGTFVTRGLPWKRWMTVSCGTAKHPGNRIGQGLARASLGLGVLLGWGAVLNGLWSAPTAGAGTLLLGAAFVMVHRGNVTSPTWRSWAMAAAVVFFLLLTGMATFFPAYHARFALLDQIVAQQRHEELPICCYPRRWDSVSFYLQRDVQAFGPGQEAELVKGLGPTERELLFVKSQSLPDLVRSLPSGWEFVPQGHQPASIVVGMVTPKR
jgi:dolichol-phosphate mannosyltransferase